MAPKGEPERPIEITTQEQWLELTEGKGNHDMNVVDIYAEWCGPCVCLLQTYKKILFDHDAILTEAMEKEGKAVRFWTVCAETIGLEELEKCGSAQRLLICVDVQLADSAYADAGTAVTLCHTLGYISTRRSSARSRVQTRRRSSRRRTTS